MGMVFMQWKAKLGMFVFLSIGLLTLGICSSAFHSKNRPLLSKIEKNAQLFEFPFYFEKNKGQTDPSVKYLKRGKWHHFYFTSKEIVMVLQKKAEENQILTSAVLKMQFIGANPNCIVKGIEKQSGHSHYFMGSDSQKWQTSISHYSKICYQELYPGIDAVFYGNLQQMEYDICIRPGTNPQDVHFRIKGAKELFIDEQGNLQLVTEDHHTMQMQNPLIYQMIEGHQIVIEGKFVLLAQNDVGFVIGSYDKNQHLVIDPVLSYSTYLGGSGNSENGDQGNSLAVDSEGNAYVTGCAYCSDFPLTSDAFQKASSTASNVFVTKLNATGTAVIYSTYLGGNSIDMGYGIVVDDNGNAYVAGLTQSTDFPTSEKAFQTKLNGSVNGFITKLNPTGTALIYSTYLGGNHEDKILGIAIDKGGNAYVTGRSQSVDFPTVEGSFRTTFIGFADSFITKIDPLGESLIYSTYLGGTYSDQGNSIAVDTNGHAYVTGLTSSSDFPTTEGVFQKTLAGSVDVFVTKMDPTGANLVYSSYLGGSSVDVGRGIALDNSGNAYITGYSISSNFPILEGAFQITLTGAVDAFITKINATGTAIIYSTYLGGDGQDQATGIALDSNGNAYITGITQSNNFPLTASADQSSLLGPANAFITKLNSTGTALIYSSYFGGNYFDSGTSIAINSQGTAYVTGSTQSTNFPLLNAFKTILLDNKNAFVASFTIGNPTVTAVSPSFGYSLGGTVVTINGTNFTSTAQTTVNFGTNAAMSFTVDSSTQITAISPAGTEKVVDIIVTTAGGSSAPSAIDQFTYVTLASPVTKISPPLDPVNPEAESIDEKKDIPIKNSLELSLTGINPVCGPNTGGTVVILRGTNFSGVTAIYFGESPATSFTVNSPNQITVISPPGVTEIVHIRVLTEEGISALSLANQFTYLMPSPLSSSIFPPRHLQGFQKINQFATQTDYINILTWKAPLEGEKPVVYKIYRDNDLKNLITVIHAKNRLKYRDHDRKKGKTYTYFIISIDQFGRSSLPTRITIKG